MTVQENATLTVTAAAGAVSEEQACDLAARALLPLALDGKRVLLIVPDLTRTAAVGLLFRVIHDLIGEQTRALDVMIALGTHPPLNDTEINARLEITPHERAGKYARIRMLNHAWDDPNALEHIGTIRADEMRGLLGELDARAGDIFLKDVNVTINRAIFDYDQLIILGPVFPHEVVGFSGGNKYLFPGISGGEILHYFHWLGAVITNPKIIGHKATAVRRVVDRAAALVPVPRFAFCMVMQGRELTGLVAGTPEAAWSQAADLSDKANILYKDHPFHTVLSCAPPMYDEVWVAGKCMYKLEPVVADGGELIIYGPHIQKISATHGAAIARVGYHTRDYFLEQWEQFKDEPWGTLAHSTHVRGIGAMEDETEKPRIQVTFATQIPESVCRAINLGYRDPASIDVAAYQNREDEGILYVAKAGEMLYRLNDPPEWARG